MATAGNAGAGLLPGGFTEEDFFDSPWKSWYEPKWSEPEWAESDGISWLYPGDTGDSELVPVAGPSYTASRQPGCKEDIRASPPGHLTTTSLATRGLATPAMEAGYTAAHRPTPDPGVAPLSTSSGRQAQLPCHAASHASGPEHKMASRLPSRTLPYQTAHRDTAPEKGVKRAYQQLECPQPPAIPTQNGLRPARNPVQSIKKEIEISSASDSEQSDMLDLVEHPVSSGYMGSPNSEHGNSMQSNSSGRNGRPSIFLNMNPNVMPVPESWHMAPLPMPPMRPIHIPNPRPNPDQVTMSLYKDCKGAGEPPYKRPCPGKEEQVLGSKIDQRRLRFLRTRYALEKSGLMEITMRTAVLLKSNNLLDQEITKLRDETKALLEALMQNQTVNNVTDS